MKGYKGFDKNMKCKGMQYEVGKEFSVDGELELCENGLHFCKYPLDVFRYYDPANSKFAKVKATGEIKYKNPDDDYNKDTKVCTNKLKICAEIGFPDLIHAAVKYIKDNIDTSKEQKTMDDENKNIDSRSVVTNTGNRSAATNTGDSSVATNTGNRSVATNKGYRSATTNTGDSSVATNIGDCSAATNTGDSSVATNIGYRSVATNIGDNSAATNTGNRSVATNIGDNSAATNTGNKSIAINIGDRSAATNTGYRSTSIATGNKSASIVTGKDSIAVSIGCKGVAKGSLGSWIVLAEYVCGSKIGKSGCIVKDVQCFYVDGKNILPDTFYRLKDGKAIVEEVDEELKELTEVKPEEE